MIATHEELTTPFDLVANKEDWRAPIDYTGYLTVDQVNRVRNAIVHFTATEPAITVVEMDNSPDINRPHLWRIEAEGYRNGPCGP